MEAYSMDLHARVIGDCDAGMRTGEVAAKYRVSKSWVRLKNVNGDSADSAVPKAAR